MVPLMLLVHFQRYGHHPIALVGGATGRVGDPSGKSAERNLLDEDTLNHNLSRFRDQLSRFLDFESTTNPAKIMNNYDWFKDFNFLDFLRDVGKHLTVNYMMSKDSVKTRMEAGSGISFTEFSYQLLQGYDFYHLYQEHGCQMQFGGSDQWGNITAGTELIRKMAGPNQPVFAFTCPLITNSEGKKFGKSEKGNIFIDPEMTSPYEFYQFFIQQGDEDIVTLAKIFSLKTIPELEVLITENNERPGTLQKALGEEMTVRIHGEKALSTALSATRLMFNKGGIDDLKALSRRELDQIFAGVPQSTISKENLAEGVAIIDFLADQGVAASKGEARRSLTKDKSISINKNKVDDPDYQVSTSDLINEQFILINKGKKKHFLIFIE
ncbi:UNVERIFIED_CONTAM: hypothetical protein GTU68_061123 [Idotea baltica]|nr:hypothetical protein [Idotea baltica]